MQRRVEIRASLGHTNFLCIVTYLPLRRWSQLPSFVWTNLCIEQQLKRASGLIRYGLKADVLRKQFWSFSVWADRAAVAAFIHAHPHATAMTRLDRWAAPGAAFVEWQSLHGQIDWDEALQRLKHPTGHYTSQPAAPTATHFQ